MKILFLAANPQSTSRLNLEREAREIQEALDISELSPEFELIQKWEVRPKDFRRALLRYTPDIVHFSGHGKGESGLIISDEAGTAKAVTGDALAGLFAEFHCVKCVLLNACYAEVQAQAIVRHVNYVIGMRDTIYDKAAIAFSVGFYDGLGYGKTIEEAFNLGSNAILWEYEHNSGKTRELIPVDSAQIKSLGNLPEHLKPILLKKVSNVPPEITPKAPKTEPVTINSNPQQKYRARIQKYLGDRNLTPITKYQLAIFAQHQGISESEANDILQAELDIIEKAKTTYQNLLKETIAQGYNPLDPKAQKDLQDIQKHLNLTDLEVAAISEAILAKTNSDHPLQSETSPESQPQPERVINVYGNYNETIQGDYHQGDRSSTSDLESNNEKLKDRGSSPGLESNNEQSTDNNNKINSNKFSFEVITVNERGEENSRTTKEAEFFSEDLGKGVILEMVKIPSGQFMMGSPEREGDEDEKPQHKVTVQSFWMGKYPVNQAQWKAVMENKNNPSYFEDNLVHPVESVSWDDANKFCQQLAQHTDKKYRLPSEAEWEYACRAITSPFSKGGQGGSSPPFYFGATITGKLANYDASITYAQEAARVYRRTTTEVGIFPPNSFGLYDMHGNIWEWCADDWHKNYDGAPQDSNPWLSKDSNKKVTRGGSWFDVAHDCRSAIRVNYARDDRNNDVGFRVVCVLSNNLVKG